MATGSPRTRPPVCEYIPSSETGRSDDCQMKTYDSTDSGCTSSDVPVGRFKTLKDLDHFAELLLLPFIKKNYIFMMTVLCT